jgi:hypothetical protein
VKRELYWGKKEGEKRVVLGIKRMMWLRKESVIGEIKDGYCSEGKGMV